MLEETKHSGARQKLPIGGYINMRHENVIYFIHNRGPIVFNEKESKLKLDPVEDQALKAGENIAEEARAHIRISLFDKDFQNTLVNVTLVNVQAELHWNQTTNEALKNAEENKYKLYKERAQKVEHASFIKLIFTS